MALLVLLTPVFVDCDSEWQDTHHTSMAGHTHFTDWECSGVVGGILVRGKDGM